MKKFLMSIVAVALCAGLAIASEQGAAGKTCPMGGKKAMSCPMMKGAKCVCTGTVESVDVAGNKITVKDASGKSMVCTVDAKTVIKVGRKKATLAGIKAGDPVEVSCKGDVAKSIKVGADMKSAEKKEAKK